jgi:hypothetical protein
MNTQYDCILFGWKTQPAFLDFKKEKNTGARSNHPRSGQSAIKSFKGVLSAYMGAIMMNIDSKYHMENIPKG